MGVAASRHELDFRDTHTVNLKYSLPVSKRQNNQNEIPVDLGGDLA